MEIERLIRENLININKLVLWDKKLTDDDLYSILDFLEESKIVTKCLNLNTNKITDIGAKYLFKSISKGKLKNLEALEIAQNQITTDALEYLAEDARLKKLNISGNQINSEGLKILFNNQALEDLDIGSNNINMDQIKQIKLPINKKITSLDLSKNPLGNAGVISIIDKLPNLRSLGVLGCGLDDNGMLKLINGNIPLTSLLASNNDISNEGVKTITYNHSLRHLTLLETKVNGGAADYFFNNQVLEAVYLSSGENISNELLTKLHYLKENREKNSVFQTDEKNNLSKS